MSLRKTQLQNARVWARRFGMELNVDKFIGALQRVDPEEGSCFKAPLTLLINKKLINKGVRREEARIVAAVTAAAMKDTIYQKTPLLFAMGHRCPTVHLNIILRHLDLAIEIAETGIAARNAEKTVPNIWKAIHAAQAVG